MPIGSLGAPKGTQRMPKLALLEELQNRRISSPSRSATLGCHEVSFGSLGAPFESHLVLSGLQRRPNWYNVLLTWRPCGPFFACRETLCMPSCCVAPASCSVITLSVPRRLQGDTLSRKYICEGMILVRNRDLPYGTHASRSYIFWWRHVPYTCCCFCCCCCCWLVGWLVGWLLLFFFFFLFLLLLLCFLLIVTHTSSSCSFEGGWNGKGAPLEGAG